MVVNLLIVACVCIAAKWKHVEPPIISERLYNFYDHTDKLWERLYGINTVHK